jgi:hypothetical protein
MMLVVDDDEVDGAAMAMDLDFSVEEEEEKLVESILEWSVCFEFCLIFFLLKKQSFFTDRPKCERNGSRTWEMKLSRKCQQQSFFYQILEFFSPR